MEKICKYCKKKFYTNKNYQKYCSVKCYNDYYINYYEKRYVSNSDLLQNKKKLIAKNGIEVLNNLLGKIYAGKE